MWLEYGSLVSKNEVGLCRGLLECLLSGPRPCIAYRANSGNISKRVHIMLMNVFREGVFDNVF